MTSSFVPSVASNIQRILEWFNGLNVFKQMFIPQMGSRIRFSNGKKWLAINGEWLVWEMQSAFATHRDVYSVWKVVCCIDRSLIA